MINNYLYLLIFCLQSFYLTSVLVYGIMVV